MKLGFVERRFMPFAKTTEIRDEEGNVRYYLTRDAVCVGFKLHLLDLSGNEIALIRQKVSLLSNKFTVTMDERTMLLQLKSNRQDGFFIEITLNGWRTFGSLYNGEYALVSDGKAIAEIRKLSHPDGEACEIACRDPEFEAEVLACVIGIEAALNIGGNDGD